MLRDDALKPQLAGKTSAAEDRDADTLIQIKGCPNGSDSIYKYERESAMAKAAFKWLLITGMISLNASGWGQELDSGKIEFKSSCAACHGADGKGKGPLSVELKIAPDDLTVLAKKNGGVFPVNSVYQIIDGRRLYNAHGTREMPIWGFRYMPSPYEAVNPSPATEVTIQTRILAIVDYLERIPVTFERSLHAGTSFDILVH